MYAKYQYGRYEYAKGGTGTFSSVASGGFVFGGVGLHSLTISSGSSGGLTLGGTGLHSYSVSTGTSGGLVFGGTDL